MIPSCLLQCVLAFWLMGRFVKGFMRVAGEGPDVHRPGLVVDKGRICTNPGTGKGVL